MKLLLLCLSFAMAGQTIPFSVMKVFDLKEDMTVLQKNADVTLPKGWSVDMAASDQMQFHMLATPTRQTEKSDVFVSLFSRTAPPLKTLEERKKKFESLPGYKVTYTSINGQNWLMTEHESPNAHAAPSIEVAGFLIKDGKEFLFLAGYPKAQPQYQKQIHAVIKSVKIH